MGAWIEITARRDYWRSFDVAPYVGAWIEINVIIDCLMPVVVAPYVGAWIEMLVCSGMARLYHCRSLCGSVD